MNPQVECCCKNAEEFGLFWKCWITVALIKEVWGLIEQIRANLCKGWRWISTKKTPPFIKGIQVLYSVFCTFWAVYLCFSWNESDKVGLDSTSRQYCSIAVRPGSLKKIGTTLNQIAAKMAQIGLISSGLALSNRQTIGQWMHNRIPSIQNSKWPKSVLAQNDCES